MVRTRTRTGTGTARAAVAAGTVVLAVALGGCGGGGDGDGGGDASPTPAEPTQTKTGSQSPSPTGSPTGTAGGAAQVMLRSTDELGKILTDAEGRTLYLFVADSSKESTCYDACAEAWPPLTVSDKPKAGGDVKAGLLGTTKRQDGDKQVTYNGHPLYYYENDDEPGELTGQGLDQFGAKWWAVDASGNKVEGQADQQEKEQEEQEQEEQPEPGY